MMEARSFGRGLLIFLLVILILLAGFAAFLLYSIQNSTRQALEPISQANEQLRTQVSAVLNPTPTIIPDPVTIVHEVRALARLETIQYTVEKVITAETGQNAFGFLFGDRLLFVAHGTVIAGVDLGLMGDDDIWWEGDTLHLRLPEPEVFVATLNNEDSYVYDRDTGLLSKGQVDLESQARQVAEQAILEAVMEDNILDQARQNAELFLTKFLRSLDYADVVFEYEPVQVTPTP
jgi:hypothetical protein